MKNNIEKYKLNNGLVVTLQKTPTKTIAGELAINYGAIHEKPSERGLAHLVEHCLTSSGSKNYSPQEQQNFHQRLGYSNQFTSIGKTWFEVNMLSKYLEQGLGVVSDSTFNLSFEREYVENERNVVLREIGEKRSNPFFSEQRKSLKEFYRGHPVEIDIVGDENIVRTTNINQLKDFYSRGYLPNNMDLILVGNLPKDTHQLIEKYFGIKKQGNNTRMKFPELKQLEKKIINAFKDDHLYNHSNPDESSAVINLTFITSSFSNPDSLYLEMLSSILGSGANSRLGTILRSKGLSYSPESSYYGDYNAGRFNINANVPAKRLEESINHIFEEVQKLRKNTISNKELNIIKDNLEFHIAKELESNEGKLKAIKRTFLRGKDSSELFKDIENTTPEKLLEVANKYFPKNQDEGIYALAVTSPFVEN